MKHGWSQGPAPEAKNFINFRNSGGAPGAALRAPGEGYFSNKYFLILPGGSKIDEIPGLGGRTLGPTMFHFFLSDAASQGIMCYTTIHHPWALEPWGSRCFEKHACLLKILNYQQVFIIHGILWTWWPGPYGPCRGPIIFRILLKPPGRDCMEPLQFLTRGVQNK